ncbi:MAG: polyhydroxyalkanoate synthesis repressor PhaR [Rhodospirillales bacterium]
MSAPENSPQGGAEPAIIKKYANRRLYNTASSSYVTLDDLAGMAREGVEFTVRDAKTGDDITRQVLTQIILEEESRGGHMLPIGFLRQLISFYGDSLQSVAPHYLESTMQAFVKNQEQMRTHMQDALGGANPFGAFDEIAKRNMAVFENAMSMFSPFGGGASEANPRPAEPAAGDTGAKPDKKGPGPDSGPGPGLGIDELRAQMAAMQEQLNRLSGKN